MEHSLDNLDCHLRQKYSSCEGLPFYAEHEGQRYCVLHLPSEDKKDDFKEVLQAKVGSTDFNFAGAFFPTGTAAFCGFKFVGANFTGAKFSGETYFSGAEFSGERTSFQSATLSREVFFNETVFRDKVSFLGTEENKVFTPEAWAWFGYVRIDKPELLTFDTVRLHPGWFINVDVRKADFTDVEWCGLPGGPKRKLKDEIKDLEERGVKSAYRLLSQACQRLATNAEENRNHLHASGFNYWAMDAQRKEKWASAFAPWRLIWWYWALSGYGERTWRSAIWLVGILVSFAVLYMVPFVGHVQVQELSLSGIWQAFFQAIVYSLGVMSRQTERLSGSESTLLRSLVFIEGILGPLQVALFALALRRRFMRGKG